MSSRVEPCPSLVRFLALRRVQRGHIVLHDVDLFTDCGRKIPEYLTSQLRALLADGHIERGERALDRDQHPVHVTQTGSRLCAELEARHAHAAHARHTVHLDRVLAGLQNL